jgi:6-pyruvoyltetrahydropterin/6-carboxytetrahydropterin synthase
MFLTLYTEEYFSAAHHIEGYDGKCSQLHGHTWKVCVWVKGNETIKQANGILWDFNNLKKITNSFDHTCLNDTLEDNPTVENITANIYKDLKNENAELLFKVRVYENLHSRHSYCEAGDF